MSQPTMKVDVDKCTVCYACFLACRDEYTGNDYLPLSAAQPPASQSWMRVEEIERGTFPKLKVSYIPIMCQQCEDAPCIEASTDGAVYRRDDGIVIIDPEKAKGQKAIVDSCPYGVIFWNAEKALAQKCTFCAHLLEAGGEPRCIEACPVAAIQLAGDRLDEGEKLHPEFGLDPAVKYAGLPKNFVTGEVVIKSEDGEECAANVTVVLKSDTEEHSTVTDIFGDFEFDGLTELAGRILIIHHDGHAPIEIPLAGETSIDLGLIELGFGL